MWKKKKFQKFPILGSCMYYYKQHEDLEMLSNYIAI